MGLWLVLRAPERRDYSRNRIAPSTRAEAVPRRTVAEEVEKRVLDAEAALLEAERALEDHRPDLRSCRPPSGAR